MSLVIQLGSKKNVNAVNVDQNLNVELKSSTKEILSFNESSSIDVSALFNSERQASESYRVYGRIDFMSIINGLSRTYSDLTDFFTPARLGQENLNQTKNLPFCFDIYLCYPLTATTVSPETFVRNYTVITKKTNLELYKAGYSTNLYLNNIYTFDFNIDFDVNGILDAFGKPINYFYLFFNFKPDTSKGEQLFSGYTSILKSIGTTPITYNPGDIIAGDIVNYVNLNFEETLVNQAQYYVDFPYSTPSPNNLQFKYYPFIPVKIRDFSDEISYGNLTGGTETDLNDIPSYAIPIDDKGNVIWKTILDNGYVDPISGKGVDFPFLNQRHYVFNTIILAMKPSLDDPNTESVFNDIHFNTNTGVYTKPATQGSLTQLGNKCA